MFYRYFKSSLALSVLSLASLKGGQFLALGSVPESFFETFTVFLWAQLTLTMIHILVIRHANRNIEIPQEMSCSDKESQNLMENLDAGVVVLDCKKYQLLYANKAADRFFVKQDNSTNTVQMVLTFDDGEN